MAINVNIEVEFSQPDVFGELTERLNDLSPYLEKIGTYNLTRATQRLLQKRDVANAPYWTGDLMRSLTPGGSGSVFEQDDNSVTVGSNKVYAAQVQFGGTIRPKPGNKALAIPTSDSLKRSTADRGKGPLELDPNREVLKFIRTRGKPNVVGVLVDEDGKLGHGKGVIYTIATSVTQQAKNYLGVDDQDMQYITEVLWSEFLDGNG